MKTNVLLGLLLYDYVNVRATNQQTQWIVLPGAYLL